MIFFRPKIPLASTYDKIFVPFTFPAKTVGEIKTESGFSSGGVVSETKTTFLGLMTRFT